MTVSNLQWAAGYNNAAGLANLEVIMPSFQSIPFTVHTKPLSHGITRTRGGGHTGLYGYPRVPWIADGMSDQQYLVIQSTFTPGGIGLSGEMTIRTLTGYPSGVATYANYSAMLYLPERTDLDDVLNTFGNVTLWFTIRAAL